MANPTDKTISLPFFSPIGGGVWGGAEQKIERKWFWSGGRRSGAEARSEKVQVFLQNFVKIFYFFWLQN